MSSFIRNLRPALSGLLRYKPAVRTPIQLPPTARRYYHTPSARRPHDVLQSSGRAVLYRPSPLLVRLPPSSPHALALPRHYSSRRKGNPVEGAFRTIMAVVIVVGGVVTTIRDGTFETVPYTNRRHLVVVSSDEERNLGESQFASLKEELGNKVLFPSHPDTVCVTGIATQIIDAARRGLASHDDDHKLLLLPDKAPEKKKKPRKARGGAQPMTKHLDELKWEVIVVDDKMVNAMCLPGGKIVVYTGLLHHFNADAEIATVLGHEIGHAIARHIAETITKSMWIAMLQVLLTIDSKDTEMVDDLTKYLLTLPFSRKMKIEADHIGILLLAAAGFNPHVAPRVYEKLGKISGNTSESKQYKHTHPASEKRSRLLSEPKIMQKAMALYREATARKQQVE